MKMKIMDTVDSKQGSASGEPSVTKVKETYEPPTLMVWGDVTDLTKSGLGAKKDANTTSASGGAGFEL